MTDDYFSFFCFTHCFFNFWFLYKCFPTAKATYAEAHQDTKKAWMIIIHTQGLGKPINGKVTSTQSADVY